MVQLLKVAQSRGGSLSVTEGVAETGMSFTEVETTLKEMVKAGYVSVDNHPETGVILYKFLELL
jgi:DNA-binding IclR family transcriptional regulator